MQQELQPLHLVRPRGLGGQQQHGDERGQERGPQGVGRGGARLVQRPARGHQGHLRQAPCERHGGGGARAGGAAHADGLQVGERAGAGSQAGGVRLHHLRRPRRRTPVRRHADLKGFRGGHRHWRCSLAALVQAQAAQVRHQVHRDGAHAHRRPRPCCGGCAQHDHHGARGQGHGLLARLRPTHHRPALRRRSRRRGGGLLGGG
mmetsp:Transcript_33769/g.84148  ORF Transcript_33769/g.84148 Transcript_33769/m.84148 type:complete len:204 (-) Transcript_33769:892-1503(-)